MRKNDARFIFFCENFLDTKMMTQEELGAVFGEKLESGLIKPLTRQAISVRRKRIGSKLGRKIDVDKCKQLV